MDKPWTHDALQRVRPTAHRKTPEHLELLAQCALGPTRGNDRLKHLEHVASYDVPLLIREITLLWQER